MNQPLNKDEMIMLTPDAHEDLLTRALWLSCLEKAGVANWSGYEEAIELFAEARGIVDDE